MHEILAEAIPAMWQHWIGFNLLVGFLLVIDLWRAGSISTRPSLTHSLLVTLGWFLAAMAFNGWIYLAFGPLPALNFLTGYLLEESLSVDNLFVFLLIFTHFRVPETAKHHVLFYGVLGAIFMRGLLIWLGIVLVKKVAWVFYPLGLFLMYTGFQLLRHKEKEADLEKSFIYRFTKRCIPSTPHYHAHRFFVRHGHQWVATPLLLVLVLIEFTDLIFALDSVPAILGITTDPYIVYTSNIFAILGLRSLFFVLEGIINHFKYIHEAVALILVFIGMKMLLEGLVFIPTWTTLLVIIFLLIGAVLASSKSSNT